MLDKLVEAGVTRAVVNVHHFANQVEAHLKARRDIEISISDERSGLLDSGGGIQHARPLLGEDPIFLANIDSLWLEGATLALEALKRAWDPAAMDLLLLLLVARGSGLGFECPPGFLMDEGGRLAHSISPDVVTPFANVGFGILKPQVLDGEGGGAFSIYPTWHRLQAQGRLYGVAMDAFWMHVGDPAARDAAEARLG